MTVPEWHVPWLNPESETLVSPKLGTVEPRRWMNDTLVPGPWNGETRSRIFYLYDCRGWRIVRYTPFYYILLTIFHKRYDGLVILFHRSQSLIRMTHLVCPDLSLHYSTSLINLRTLKLYRKRLFQGFLRHYEYNGRW